MMAHTHIALGISSGLLLVGLSDSAPPSAVELFALAIGALAPDIDAHNSTISKPGSLFSRFLPKEVRIFFDMIGAGINSIVNCIFGHRGFFHWPVLGAAVMLVGLWCGQLWLCWFAVGYLSHILGDMLTVQGAPLLAPFYRKSISLVPLRTGSWAESVISILLWAYVCWAGYGYLPAGTRQWLERYGNLPGGFL
jgi:inner membrane protein